MSTQLPKNKRSAIIEIMENQPIISIKELSEKLNCTEMTVRRNLDQLQELDFVKREHGYARLLKTAEPITYYEQSEVNVAEKKAIAAAALTLIHPYDSICLDSGTSIQNLVDLIPDNLPLSIITPNLIAANTLMSKNQIQVFMPNGFLDHNKGTLVLTDESALDLYKADIAFLSCRSLRLPEGTFEHTNNLLLNKRALSSIATKKILLIDYAKWGMNSLCQAISLKDIDIIITDRKAPADMVEAAANMGKEIIVVDPDSGEILSHYNKSN